MRIWWLLFLLVVFAKFPEKIIEFWNELARKNLFLKLKEFKKMHDGRAPKNVILFIGDGMGITSLTAARLHKAEKNGTPGKYDPFFMESFDSTGWSKTASWDRHVTDSAAGAVALLTGLKVEHGTLGVRPGFDSNCRKESKIFDENVAELSIKKGLSVGIVTTTSLVDATPAAAYAKGISRTLKGDQDDDKKTGCEGQDIAIQLLMKPANEFTVLMGGGKKYMVNRAKGGERQDYLDIIEMWKKLPGKRQVITEFEELENLETDDPELKFLGVFGNDHLKWRDYGEKLTLKKMTNKTIRMLANNKKGFFALIEGALIDKYEHSNNIRQQSEELIQFDEAIRMAREMTFANETLIIVTADHSHSLAVGEFDSKRSLLTDIGREKKGVAFSHGPGFNKSRDDKETVPTYLYADTGYHGGDHVPIYADGPYSWLFSSTIQNTEIGFLMKYLLCLKEECVSSSVDTSTEGSPSELPSTSAKPTSIAASSDSTWASRELSSTSSSQPSVTWTDGSNQNPDKDAAEVSSQTEGVEDDFSLEVLIVLQSVLLAILLFFVTYLIFKLYRQTK